MNTRLSLPTSLDQLLPAAAERRPGDGIAILDRRGARDFRDYRALAAAVERRAGQLVAHGLCAGEPALIALDTSFEWLDCWFGAVRMGALPVAIAPAGAMGSGRAHLDKLHGIVDQLDVRAVIGGEGLRREAAELGLALVADRCVTTAELDALAPAPHENPRSAPDEIAFLQLTSGSTGIPRAVCIRHASILHQLAAITHAMGMDDADTESPHGVSWLPLHHDMGMVGALLASIANGWSLDLIPSRAFLARPESWLAAIANYDRAISPAPNFAYQACVERGTGSRLDGADLSGWRIALTGAEMVRPETTRAFAAEHAALGFDARAIRPCYGLAEATLAVTFDSRGLGVRTAPIPGDPTGAEVVCVGEPVIDTLVRITDEHGDDLPERTVGAVRVDGPGVFAGYYRNDEATAASLIGGELVTGDLGFLQDGELYITGRTKDLLILRGSNWMPHELEWRAEAVLGGGGMLRAGAFSVEGGARGELAVIAGETGETDAARLAELAREIRVNVGRELGIALHDVVLVRRGRIPKTSSGKVQRGELRRLYTSGGLERLDEPKP
ncbi:MAG: AMP-binding protein [Planctomycetes bacterium]|nr:AMP-binding protein [Planctomycetota bacterium]